MERVLVLYALYIIIIEDRDEHKCCKSCGEAAVIKHESAVHLCGHGAYHSAERACENAVSHAVSACYGAESGGEGKAIDIRLCGERPGNVEAADQADANDRKEERYVAEGDRKDVSRVLTVGGKGERGKDDAHGGPGEADSQRKRREYLGENKDEIEIYEDRKAVQSDIYHTHRHTELIGEIDAVTGASDQRAIASEASAVCKESPKKSERKEDRKKYVHKSAIGVGHRVVLGILDGYLSGIGNAESLIHKCVDKDAEDTDSESCFIEVITAVHRRSTGKKCGDDEACRHTADEREDNSNRADLGFRRIEATYGITEEHLADEGREGGREEGDVNVLGDALLHNLAEYEHAEEGRPHIEKVESVEAMSDDEHISCQDRRVRLCAAEVDHKICNDSAHGGVKERAAESAEGEVIGDQLAGRGQNTGEVVKEVPLLRINDGNRRRNEEKERDENGIKAYQLHVLCHKFRPCM